MRAESAYNAVLRPAILNGLLPLQAQMVRHSNPQAGPLSAGFDRAFRQWSAWGGLATLLPILSLVLMVFKPQLWP